MQQEQHIPVLLREAVDALNIAPDGVYVDGTFGRGGHAAEILKKLSKQGRLVCFDRDPVAIELGRSFYLNDARVSLVHGAFSELEFRLQSELGINAIDGLLLDLGVSSPQLDQADRGFSFMRDGPLDMRMDTTSGVSAADWLAEVEETELVQVLFDLGEEKFARRIARAIVESREQDAIVTTLQLSKIVSEAIPKKDKNKHPATRTFQAIRLYVNKELTEVAQVLPQALRLLNDGGRLAVISFHSLEDRIVKRFIRQHSTPSLPPKNIPVSDLDYQTPLSSVGRAIKPSPEEVQRNTRSRSSILRIAERTSVSRSEGVVDAR